MRRNGKLLGEARGKQEAGKMKYEGRRRRKQEEEDDEVEKREGKKPKKEVKYDTWKI